MPESVSKSISTSFACTSNRLYPAAVTASWRSVRVVIRSGSTEWIRNGSMIVRKVGALMATTVLAHDTPMHRPGSVVRVG